MAQSNVKVEVELDDKQRTHLAAIVRSGTVSARRVRQARVLLLADEDRREGRRPDWYISEQTGISLRQICRIRQQFVREGLDPTLGRKQRSDAGIPKTLAEMELSILSRQCIQRCFNHSDDMSEAIAAWEKSRNEKRLGATWRFTTADARIKLEGLYPQPDK